MKPSTRQRVFRNFAASLMQSELSLSELEKIADELSSGYLAQDLADFLRREMLALVESNRPRATRIQDTQIDNLILDILMRRKLSKRSLANIIETTSPRANIKQLLSRGTSRGLVVSYLKQASFREKEALLRALQSSRDFDPYLKGIVQRG